MTLNDSEQKAQKVEFGLKKCNLNIFQFFYLKNGVRAVLASLVGTNTNFLFIWLYIQSKMLLSLFSSFHFQHSKQLCNQVRTGGIHLYVQIIKPNVVSKC